MTTYAPQHAERWWLRPAGMVLAAYLAVLLLGILLLLLPIAKAGEGSASLMEAAFTATSVVSVTGLSIVDTATFWSGFGQFVIFVLCEIGGLGVMTLTSLVMVRLSHRLGLRARMSTATEAGGFAPGNIREVVVAVGRVALIAQSVIAVVLAIRFAVKYDFGLGDALWNGMFLSASAFNNLGYALFSDNLVSYGTDPFVILPLVAGVVLGGLGLPVLLEAWRHRARAAARLRRLVRRGSGSHPNGYGTARWSIHTRIVLYGTGVLLSAGFAIFLATEWANPGTLGPMGVGDKLLSALSLSAFPRTGGFNSVDLGQLRSESWFTTDILMFIGAGPASTAGGLKITTLVVLAAVAVSEIRGTRDTHIYDRTIPATTQRTAVAVASAFTAVVLGATWLMLAMSPFPLEAVLTEVISAVSTVGLSRGITPLLDAPDQVLLMILMFIGRLGPVTFAAAIALSNSTRHYTLPEERPFIG